MDIENRIFELIGEDPVGARVITRVVDEYGIDRETARSLYVKVRTERVSPQHERTKEAIERLGKLSFI